jgi:hypothetical protein
MPFGNSLGEFVFKMTSVRQTDLGGGQVRVEADFAGEVTGEAPGNHYGTLTATVSSKEAPGRPVGFTYVGATLAASGATVGVTASGVAQRAGASHNIRYRGAVRYSTTDPKFAALNDLIGAVESEFDAATQTLKGAACEWK